MADLTSGPRAQHHRRAEVRSAKENHEVALMELADEPTRELRRIERDTALHTWYRDAVTKILKQREDR